MNATDGFVDAVLAAPLGASWLGVLEAGPAHHGDGWLPAAATSDASSVAAAVDRVGELSFGSLMRAAVYAGYMECGPWIGEAVDNVAAAARAAERRAPIAEAVAARFGAQLHAPLDHHRQQWFTDGSPGALSDAPRFVDFDKVYDAGEFTWAGLWTATDPPPEAIVEMVGAWELETGRVERWSMPVHAGARVYEIHRPQDWARLVTTHPRPGRPYSGWELPGPNQRRTDLAPLMAVPQQHAARMRVAAHLVPDWADVAAAYDGVHLSWAGLITSEGCVVDLGGGDVAMLRYWFSERTHWLANVFGEPTLAPDPGINLAADTHWPPLPPRVTVDRELIGRLLGRTAST